MSNMKHMQLVNNRLASETNTTTNVLAYYLEPYVVVFV